MVHRSRMVARLICLQAIGVLLLAGCADDQSEEESQVSPRQATTHTTTVGDVGGSGVRALPAAAPEGAGPRALPPSFVDLDVGAFPRPAEEACADNTRTVEVSDGRGLAEAVREAEAGTTILVEPGTYRDDNEDDHRALVFDVPDVCLRSSSGSGSGQAGGEVVLEPDDEQNVGVAIGASDVVLEGIEIRGFATGIGLEHGEGGETLEGITLESVTIREPSGEFREGIVSFGDNRDVRGEPAALDGLLLLDITIEGTDLGISCNAGPCAHWWLEGVSVTGRVGSEDSGADAFAIEEGGQIAIVDSEFVGAAADGIDTKATDVVVYGASVRDVERNGIKLWDGGDVIDTVVNGSGADAALVGEAPARYRYLHVLVTRHAPGDEPYVGTWGFDEGEPVELEIVNSVFAGNSPGGFYVPEGSTVSIRNTIFDDPDAKLFDVGEDAALGVGDLTELEARGWVTNVLIADPQLVDVEAGDLATGEGSPARDAGESIDGLERDLLGNARSSGAGPDIGPVES